MNSKNVARVLLVILLVTTVHSAIASNSHSVVVYFYGECPRCVSYVKAFERDFSAVGITDIEEIDYSRDATGLEALRELRERLHVPQELSLIHI